ncbi:MAG: oxygenase MpaB family protein [Solirubrobacterales bacterium]
MTSGTGPGPIVKPVAAKERARSPFRRFGRADRLAEFDAGLVEHADWGLFGPDSVTWRVHSHPIIVVGGFRALMIQCLNPLAMAGVAQYSDFMIDPLKRFRRTAQYVHHVVFSDTQSAREAAARVRTVHEHVHGIDPVTGREFHANDPELLLWVHCVEAHSFLTAYRTFVRELPREDQDRYLSEQVAAAELIGVPRELVPDSVDAYREYFAKMLPTLCTSKSAAETIRFVARPNMRIVPVSEWPFAINLKIAGHAAVTVMPRSLRQIAGLPKPGPREWAFSRWIALNAKTMDRALHMPPLAAGFDQIASRKMGTGPIPALARRSH